MRKRFTIFLISFLLINSNGKNVIKQKTSEKLTTKALFDVISELFPWRRVSFDITVIGDVSPRVGDRIDDLMKHFEGIQSIKVTKSTNIDFTIVENIALVFVSSKLAKSINKIKLQKWLPGINRILFYFDRDNKIDLNLLQINLTHSSRSITQYSYYFIDTGSKIELKTFEWWTEVACNQPQLITLNSFDKKSVKWQTNLNIQDKFINFHGCTLNSKSENFRLFFLDYMRFYGLLDLNPGFKNDYVKKEKIEAKLARIFAEQGNFSIYRTAYDIFADESEFYVLYQEGNSYKLDVLQSVVCPVPLYDVSLYILHSPPEPYTNYEKMVLPFDADTWIFLMITFGASFVSIFLINFLPRAIQDIFYGQRINTAFFNVIRAGFGISQTILPENNFGRILLLFFTLFCLIFRTAYQGFY